MLLMNSERPMLFLIKASCNAIPQHVPLEYSDVSSAMKADILKGQTFSIIACNTDFPGGRSQMSNSGTFELVSTWTA